MGKACSHYGYYFKKLAELVNVYNRVRFQSTETDVCGQYCIYYGYMKSKGVEFNDICADFGRDRTENDTKVVQFCNSLNITFTGKKHEQCSCSFAERVER